MLSRLIRSAVVVILGAGLVAVIGCGPKETVDLSKVDFVPDETRSGPVGVEFNSDTFAIVRVLRQPKQLSAFGYASLYDDSREVGRMDEGQKWLEGSERGERLVFSWQYKGDPGAAATARIELYRQRDTEPVVIEEAYTDLTRGRHRIAYNNRGNAYRDKGAVMRWQFQILSGGKVVAQKQSAMWQSMVGGAPQAANEPSAETPSAE